MSVIFPPIDELLIITEEAAKMLPSDRRDACVYVTIYADEAGNFDYSINERNPRYDGLERDLDRYSRYPHSATMAVFSDADRDTELAAEGLLAGLYRCKKEMDILEPVEEDKGWGHLPGGYYAEERARPKLTQLGEIGVYLPSSSKTRSPRPFFDDDDIYDSPDPADREDNPIGAIVRALPALARGAAAAGRGVGRFLSSDTGMKITATAVSTGANLISKSNDKEDKEAAQRVKNALESPRVRGATRRINAGRAANSGDPKHIKTHRPHFFYR